MEGGSFSHNGQIGIAGSGGEGSRIEGVEIAFNNYAGYDADWEAGGTQVLGNDRTGGPEFLCASQQGPRFVDRP